MKAYKVFTHDLKSPIQKGKDSVWEGSLPYELPVVAVDTSAKECAAGWNACLEPHTALKIAGLWPDGYPSRLFVVNSGRRKVTSRGDKLRASSWVIERECTEEEVENAIGSLSQIFGEYSEEMAKEQVAWRKAFMRPGRDAVAVEKALRVALDYRGLNHWSLQRYSSVKEIWDAWGARDARAVWDTRAAWDTRDAWAARAARAAWAAWAARDARATRDAWDAWDTRAAWDALTVFYTAKKGSTKCLPDLLVAGIRDAYSAGLSVVLPVTDNALGWAMEEGCDGR